jgi:replication factor A1
MTIDRLKSRMRGINIKAKVIEIPPSRSVLTRLGTTAMVSNVLIGDETGKIRISLWNDQIDKVRVGDEVKLENCYVANYLGQPQLRLGRKGTISVN